MTKKKTPHRTTAGLFGPLATKPAVDYYTAQIHAGHTAQRANLPLQLMAYLQFRDAPETELSVVVHFHERGFAIDEIHGAIAMLERDLRLARSLKYYGCKYGDVVLLRAL